MNEGAERVYVVVVQADITHTRFNFNSIVFNNKKTKGLQGEWNCPGKSVLNEESTTPQTIKEIRLVSRPSTTFLQLWKNSKWFKKKMKFVCINMDFLFKNRMISIYLNQSHSEDITKTNCRWNTNPTLRLKKKIPFEFCTRFVRNLTLRFIYPSTCFVFTALSLSLKIS